MNDYMKYLPTLNSLIFKENYVYAIADEISLSSNKNLRTDAGAFFSRSDGKVSKHPRSKFEEPSEALLASIVETHDPEGTIMENMVEEHLGRTIRELNTSKLDYLSTLHAIHTTDCVHHYKHHGEMINLSSMDSDLIWTIIDKIVKLLSSIKVNSTAKFKSNYLNAEGRVSKYSDHGVLFINKHEMQIHVYPSGDIAVCPFGNVEVFRIAALLIKIHNTLKELPDGLHGVRVDTDIHSNDSFDYIIYNNAYIDGTITVNDLLDWSTNGNADIQHKSTPIDDDNIGLCFDKKICILGDNNDEEIVAAIRKMARSVNAFNRATNLLN